MSLRVCCVGLHAGVGHLREYKERNDVEVAGVCDLNEELARERAAEYGGNVYLDFEQMLDKEKPDAVSIATPPALHAPMTEMAAARGIHVLCEKPMAGTVADGERMIAAADKAGVKLMIAFKKRFCAPYQFIKEKLDSGLGPCLWACARYALGRVEKDWFWKEGDGGGPLVENSAHMLDMIRYLMGDVAEVRAAGGNLFMKHRAPQVDAAAVVLRFASGGVASLGLGYGCEWAMAREELVLSSAKVVFEVQGRFDRGDALRYVMRQDPGEPVTVPFGEDADLGGFRGEIAHFVECIRDDREPMVRGQDGLAALRLSLAIKEACRTGQTISLC